MTVFDQAKLKNYPQEPGVYLMKDAHEKILYIGKAKHLKNRLKQYFQDTDTRQMIPMLLSQVATIDTIITPNEKEALILENNLIKKHKPKYNILLKDDKMFVSLVVTTKHPWPMLKLIRHKGSQKKDGLYFGPYTNSLAAKETFDQLTSLFPLRQCSDQELNSRSRPCILYSMKKCIAPCVNRCTKAEYDHYVDQTVQFLKGNQSFLIDSLKEKMYAASEKLEFEKAGQLLKTIQRLEHIQVHNKSLVHSNRINVDAIGFARHLGDVLITKLIFREGKLLASTPFFFEQVIQDDDQLLTQFLLQHYQHQKDFPKEILVPFFLQDSSIITEIFKEFCSHTIKIQCPEKSEKKQIIDLACKNAHAMIVHHCQQQQVQESLLLELQKHCHLTRFPMVMECFDTSNLSGNQAVASMVTFINGKKEPKLYRDYHIKSQAQDDYHAMYEVMHRRYSKATDEHPLPDLIIVDGGKGQLGIAKKVLQELSIASCDVIALTKEEGRHDKGLSKEKVFSAQMQGPIVFSERSPVLFLLQQIRDEAHRRAISLQRKRRSKKLMTSELISLKGIGPKKQAALLKKFGSVKGIKKASKQELASVKILSEKDIATLEKFQSSLEP